MIRLLWQITDNS